jgi:hypothetical protein
MSVSAGILVIVVAILLAAAAGTFALAFGLGGREGARALNAAASSRTHSTCQTIGLGEPNGQIVVIEPKATVLGTEDGVVRLPTTCCSNRS